MSDGMILGPLDANMIIGISARCAMRTLRGRSMKLNLLLEDKREEILRIAAEHGAREVRVFGSAGRPMGRAM
jgi:hypothetical protein